MFSVSYILKKSLKTLTCPHWGHTGLALWCRRRPSAGKAPACTNTGQTSVHQRENGMPGATGKSHHMNNVTQSAVSVVKCQHTLMDLMKPVSNTCTLKTLEDSILSQFVPTYGAQISTNFTRKRYVYHILLHEGRVFYLAMTSCLTSRH